MGLVTLVNGSYWRFSAIPNDALDVELSDFWPFLQRNCA